MGMAYSTHGGEEESIHRTVAGNLEGKGPVGRIRRRWEDNNKTDFREVG
jgi:hypothetical protein